MGDDSEARSEKTVYRTWQGHKQGKSGQLKLSSPPTIIPCKKTPGRPPPSFKGLKAVQLEIEEWHRKGCEKIKLLSKAEEIDSYESVRIHHHKLHSKQIKGCSILKLQCDIEVLEGHDICAKY